VNTLNITLALASLVPVGYDMVLRTRYGTSPPSLGQEGTFAPDSCRLSYYLVGAEDDGFLDLRSALGFDGVWMG
jgi:hypothetical protein